MHDFTEITKHLNIAQLAIELHKVRNAVEPAKHAYYTVLREFSKGEITQELDPRDEECAAIIAYSADAYKAYQATKRKVYNAQRRLDTACRKVA